MLVCRLSHGNINFACHRDIAAYHADSHRNNISRHNPESGLQRIIDGNASYFHNELYNGITGDSAKYRGNENHDEN